MPKRVPDFRSDEEAEAFLEQDLSDLDHTGALPVHFELRRKDRVVSLRLSDALLAAVKRTAHRQGIPYQRLMRQAIEQAVTAKPPAGKPQAGAAGGGLSKDDGAGAVACFSANR